MGDGDTNVVQKRGDTAKFDSINLRIFPVIVGGHAAGSPGGLELAIAELAKLIDDTRVEKPLRGQALRGLALSPRSSARCSVRSAIPAAARRSPRSPTPHVRSNYRCASWHSLIAEEARGTIHARKLRFAKLSSGSPPAAQQASRLRGPASTATTPP